jgi:hypothetical protein
MALLEEIEYSPGEGIQDMYDKINLAIQKINSVLGGGAADQIPAKVDGVDFNTQFVNSFLPTGASNLKIAKVSLGDWNMQSVDSISVAHGIADFSKIIIAFARVRNDANTSYTDVYSGEGASIIWDATNVIITIRGDGGDFFESTDYNSTSYNRGDMTIIYEG